MKRMHIASIASVSIVVVGVAVLCHESAHVLAGWLAGGAPTLLTATEVKGDFSMLSPFGFVALGISGSLANVVLAALGGWALRRRWASAEAALAAWLAFGVNGMLVVTAMAGEALVGFGDWMTILGHLPGTPGLRVAATAVGTLGIAVLVRRSGAALARLLPPGEPASRVAEGRRIVGIGAAAATLLLLGASVGSPVGLTRAGLLAAGAGLGPFVPLFFGVRFVARVPSDGNLGDAPGGRAWRLAAAVVAALLWLVVGPGIPLAWLAPRG